MTEGDALVYSYLLDGKGGGEVVDWHAIDNWDSSQGLLWIHLDSKMIEARIWLQNKRGHEIWY
jgi:zinc transporter